MGNIIELDEQLANQINAGEVVVRPANAVKELVENAIDAGASRIEVAIEEAGLKKIEVVDNGSGILGEDVPLAIRPHATSKIKAIGDLQRLRSLGFRGEALPSIASISRMTIETSTADESAGSRLVAMGPDILTHEPGAKRRGTKIIVEELFYNTPARLKFIKSLQAEVSQILNIMNRLALAHPEIAFVLTNEGREQLRTAGNGDMRQVIAAVYGMRVAKKIRKIQGEDLDHSITGFVSLPELTWSNRNRISLFINGRYIWNLDLNRAIIEGYGSKLMVGRFPLAVISISMDPHLVGVNVHPTKQEVELSKKEELKNLIRQAIRETLADEVLIPDALENLNGQLKEKPTAAPEPARPAWTAEPVAETISQVEERPSQPLLSPQKEEVIFQELFDAGPQFLDETEEKAQFPALQFLGQLHATYLLCQAEDGLYIVDQHAAQERFKYEYWRDKIGEVQMEQQSLLMPYIFDFPKDEFIQILEQKEGLEVAGVFLEEYGDQQFILREHPTWMPEARIEEVVKEMIDRLLASREISVKALREDLAIMIACKSSIKAHDVLDADSCKRVLTDLASCKNPYNCPHGRPTMVHFTGTDLEKMFRRIMQSHLSKASSWKLSD
ncbi:DNA mismatch repair endonuclease MutL [Lactococcus termiticola]|uniref:DNA mismatch repair protein MutL n=1 Tax=Lactococcus termiticola TaxID=2169526 RepID=A0A2R5HFI2_9LACT|nr:DNA mismatch repair endonuclease MutL [Lactococcus termiticola]GBG96596.1 DNA mismatch repair protein MutL [Lactococcus termiticola]